MKKQNVLLQLLVFPTVSKIKKLYLEDEHSPCVPKSKGTWVRWHLAFWNSEVLTNTEHLKAAYHLALSVTQQPQTRARCVVQPDVYYSYVFFNFKSVFFSFSDGCYSRGTKETAGYVVLIQLHSTTTKGTKRNVNLQKRLKGEVSELAVNVKLCCQAC